MLQKHFDPWSLVSGSSLHPNSKDYNGQFLQPKLVPFHRCFGASLTARVIMDTDKKINHAGEESNVESQAEDKKGDGQEQPQFQNKRRGMKPKSQRNRKRARSEAHSIENQTYETRVSRLELDGKAIHTSTGWLRTVEPYPYTFSTFAKARWLGRTVLDVYCTEFGSYPKSYYESGISQGRILVSDQKVDTGYLIKGGDVLTHTVHRHEPGVAVYSNDSPFVRVVEETDDVLVVDKPGTLPVHACGGYHVQSLMNILEPFGKLYTIHRLDRLTSGLVILGKNSKVAQEWGKCIMDRNCRKIYLARVAGKFPLKCPAGVSRLDSPEALSNGEWTNLEAETSEERVVIARKRNAHGYWITDMSGSVQKDVTHQHLFDSPKDEDVWLESLKENTTVSQLSWFNLACPTRIAQPKDGICEAGTFDDLDTETYIKTVKPAETAFGVVRYDAETDSTVVLCRPATGRTHQIRIHLQHLGHPIANDPNYGGDMWHGNPEGLQACASAQEKLDAMNDANKEEIDRLNSGKGEALAATFSATIDVPATEAEIQNGISGAVREEKETIHEFIKRTCVWCARCRIGGVDRNALEFLIRSPGIWLHALQYSFAVDGGTKSFRTPFPSWNAASLPATEDQK